MDYLVVRKRSKIVKEDELDVVAFAKFICILDRKINLKSIRHLISEDPDYIEHILERAKKIYDDSVRNSRLET